MSEKKVFHNIINGEVQASASGAMMDIINPSTGEVYASAPNSDAHDVDQAFQAAGTGVREVAMVDAERATAGAAQARRRDRGERRGARRDRDARTPASRSR